MSSMDNKAEKRIRRIVYCGEQLMVKRLKMWDARYQRACAEAQTVEELDEAMRQLHEKFPEIGLDKIVAQQQRGKDHTPWPSELMHDEMCATRFGVSAACDCSKNERESHRPADDDRCGGRNTLTRRASGDIVS